MSGILSNLFNDHSDLRPTDPGLGEGQGHGSSGEGYSAQQEEQMAADRGDGGEGSSGDRYEASTGETEFDTGIAFSRDVNVEQEVTWQDADGATHSNMTSVGTGVDADVDVLLSSSANTAVETMDDF